MPRTKRRRDAAAVDPVAMRAEFHRSIAEWAELWRDCPRQKCRRGRTCLDVGRCAAARPAPAGPLSAEDEAAWAMIRRLLEAKAGR